ncbi:MAG: hypothetical protein Kilf2KO_47690 [Rhodospirillales bacterium]
MTGEPPILESDLRASDWLRFRDRVAGAIEDGDATRALSLQLRQGRACRASVRGACHRVSPLTLSIEELALTGGPDRSLEAPLAEICMDLWNLRAAVPCARGWLTLCQRAPLWIEHLLRDLPLTLRVLWKGADRPPTLLLLPGLLLTEAAALEGQCRERLVRCRFSLP